MKRFVAWALAATIAAAPVEARPVKVVTPLPAAVIGAAQITKVDVVVGDTARTTFDALELKASAKKSTAGTAATPEERRDEFRAALPFAEMFPQVLREELDSRNLVTGRALKLSLQVDALKTADAGAALLIGSADELAGVVTLADATTGETLGEYYVDVTNFRSGIMGLALRGSGVREKLAAEFSKHIAEILKGKYERKPGQA